MLPFGWTLRMPMRPISSLKKCIEGVFQLVECGVGIISEMTKY